MGIPVGSQTWVTPSYARTIPTFVPTTSRPNYAPTTPMFNSASPAYTPTPPKTKRKHNYVPRYQAPSISSAQGQGTNPNNPRRGVYLRTKYPPSEGAQIVAGRQAPTIPEENLSEAEYSQGSHASYKPTPPTERAPRKGAKTAEKLDKGRVQREASLNATYLLELVLGYENTKARVPRGIHRE